MGRAKIQKKVTALEQRLVVSWSRQLLVGEGWVFLDWKKPADGGAVAAYKIERRELPASGWTLISMAIESEATLNNQERGKEWEYRVIATNKAGEGVPSNTVAAVL